MIYILKMVKKRKPKVINLNFGHIIFLVGLGLAIVGGLFSNAFTAHANGVIIWVLVLLGVIIGLLNITARETAVFLISTLALLVTMSVLKLVPIFGDKLVAILNYVSYLIAAAALVVALEAIYALASRR